MTQSEFEKALAVLYRQRTATVRTEALAALLRIAGTGTIRRSKSSSPRAQGRRRSSAEVTALGEKLFAALEKHPGSTMMQLAEKLSSSTRELHRPMTLLKRAGRVRTTGKKNHTKYHPMARA
ncbi:MAG: hypothetical protein GY944_24585 [bacterium]|nr:hypothetical protein [bacterium]